MPAREDDALANPLGVSIELGFSINALSRWKRCASLFLACCVIPTDVHFSMLALWGADASISFCPGGQLWQGCEKILTFDNAILQFSFDTNLPKAFRRADVDQKSVDIAATPDNSNEGLRIEVTTPHRGHASSILAEGTC